MEIRDLDKVFYIAFILIVGLVRQSKYREAIENKRIDWGRRRSSPLTGEAAVQEAKAQLVITQITTWALVGLTLLVVLTRT